MNNIETRIENSAEYIKSKIGRRKPKVVIILGSGLGDLADQISNKIEIPYKDIPNFPISTAIGHKGVFVSGKLGDKQVLAMQGRFHYYEGYPMENITIPIRVMAKLGVEYLFASNAAGALNTSFKIGEPIIIKDHINLMPNPLIGPNLEEFGPRFPDMTCPYDLELQKKAVEIGGRMGLKLNKGVYVGTSGPTYETPAEVRYFRAIGGDLVGMSTVPEVIVARHCSLRVFGMSCVTNISNDKNIPRNLNDGDDVVEEAAKATKKMSKIFTELIKSL